MFLITVVVFSAVFTAVWMVVSAMSARSRERSSMADRLESLTLALARNPGDEGLNVLREELLSGLPWLDRLLHQFELFPRFRKILLQTDLNWSVGRLLG